MAAEASATPRREMTRSTSAGRADGIRAFSLDAIQAGALAVKLASPERWNERGESWRSAIELDLRTPRPISSCERSERASDGRLDEALA